MFGDGIPDPIHCLNIFCHASRGDSFGSFAGDREAMAGGAVIVFPGIVGLLFLLFFFRLFLFHWHGRLDADLAPFPFGGRVRWDRVVIGGSGPVEGGHREVVET